MYEWRESPPSSTRGGEKKGGEGGLSAEGGGRKRLGKGIYIGSKFPWLRTGWEDEKKKRGCFEMRKRGSNRRHGRSASKNKHFFCHGREKRRIALSEKVDRAIAITAFDSGNARGL